MATDDERWERSKRAAQMHASGLSIPEIADTLKITVPTIEQDLKRFFKHFLDFQLVDGTVLGSLLFQIDNIIALALGGYSRAMRTIFNQEGESVQVPDHHVRNQYLGTALDAIKEKGAVLGLKRTEISPILQIFQGKGDEGGATALPEIASENIPELRRLMRKTRTLLNRDPVKTVADVERRMLAQGVKQPPYDHELPGVLIEREDEDDKDAGLQATPL